MKIAVIDVGSNAIRMAIGKPKNGSYTILHKFRYPIRLGADVFRLGYISKQLIGETLKAFMDFKKLCNDLEVEKIVAIGTSALRNAQNQKEVVDLIKKESTISIEVIDGQRESELAFKAINHKVDLKSSKSLLIDIGGGSVELIAVKNGKIVNNKSFPIGTVRLLSQMSFDLNKLQSPKGIADMEVKLSEAMDFIKKSDLNYDFCVGIGGNIERMCHVHDIITHQDGTKELGLYDIKHMYDLLMSNNIKDRIRLFDLREDQADVIIPAIIVVICVMQTAKVKNLKVPGTGIKDSLFLETFNK